MYKQIIPDLNWHFFECCPVRISGNLLRFQSERSQSSPAKPQTIGEALDRIRQSNPFREIENPVAWQCEIKKDRDLFESSGKKSRFFSSIHPKRKVLSAFWSFSGFSPKAEKFCQDHNIGLAIEPSVD